MRRARGRGRALRWLTTFACAGTMVVAGCGGGAHDSGRSGGTIRVSYTAFPETLDPALASSQSALQTLRAVYTPLLSYKHAGGADGATIVPGLAEQLPEVSLDGRTYLLKLREKLRYSDGTPVHASDFEHAIRRVLRMKSKGASHFRGILGADEYVKAGKPDADISGIATSDRTNDLTITLKQPDARFPEVLALEYGALVPGGTPFSDQTRTPPPGIGPYRLADVRAGRSYALVRAPRFALGGQPAGKLDKLVVSAAGATDAGVPADYAADPPATATAGTRMNQPVTRATLLFGKRTLSAAFSDRIDVQDCTVWNPVFSLDLARLCVK
jgi:peptide/nickel transport system substrate-binding protein